MYFNLCPFSRDMEGQGGAKIHGVFYFSSCISVDLEVFVLMVAIDERCQVFLVCIIDNNSFALYVMNFSNTVE